MALFWNVGIAKKLGIMATVGVASTLAVGAMALAAQRGLWDDAERLRAIERANAQLNHLDTRASELKANAYRAVIVTDPALVAETSDDQRTVTEALAGLAALDLPSDLRTRIADLKPVAEGYSQFVVDFVAAAQRDPRAAAGRIDEVTDRNHEVDDQIDALRDRVAAALATAEDGMADRTAVARWIGIAVLLVGLAVFAVVSVTVIRSITRSLARVRSVLAGLAAGDLTRRADLRSSDEMGIMAASLDTAVASLRRSISAFGADADRLASASQVLMEVNTDFAKAVQVTDQRTGEVSGASALVSENVTAVAASTEQMMASIQEIGRSASHAATVVTAAVEEATEANAKVERLTNSSREIGEVLSMISSIAAQTNLLALNATIEAARAGAAGKGFAVVANEVKELAQATARATDDIRDRITAIQADTTAAAAAIRHVGSVVEDVNSLQTTIVGAVEQQTATTTAISRNLAGVAGSAQGIAQGIADVAAASTQATAGVNRARGTVDEVAGMSRGLRDVVGQFRY